MAAKAKYYRIIDANLNRCREGLRVVEDTARFVLGDEAVYKEARRMRHRLAEVTKESYPKLLAWRDTKTDAGRTVPEGRRPGLDAVLGANLRRAEESLRVLEEYGRMLAPKAGPELKKLRFAAYRLEQKLLAKK